MSVIRAVSAADSEVEQRRVAGALHAQNLRAGDRIVLSLPGSIGYLNAVLGASRSGVVPVPLDPRLTPYERDAIIDQVEPTLVVEDAADLTHLLDGPEAE